MSEALTDLLRGHDVVICAGSGGVGKTTTSAALGLAAARAGRRVVVVTVDPARRLADALGLGPGGLGDEPVRIEGIGPGELWAAMLDPRATFDRLIARHADPDQAERIIANPFYRNMADALSGTHEYMAAEKLHDLAGDERFDLVVVDTPPTRSALDFVDAPTTLTRFLDHRLYRILMAPTRRMTRAVGVAAGAFVRTVSKVVGASVVEDAIDFFSAFEGLEAGFRQRAHEVADRFRADTTAFVLVTAPRTDALGEARWFAERLGTEGIEIRAVVANRVQPRPFLGDPRRFRELARSRAGSDLGELCAAVVDQCDGADAESHLLAELVSSVGGVPLVTVPVLDRDVADLSGLGQIAEALRTA